MGKCLTTGFGHASGDYFSFVSPPKMVEWKRKLEILSWSSVVQTLEIFALNSHDNHDPHSDISELNHCVKSGQIRSFFWSVFSRIRTEYGEILYLSVFIPNAGKHGPEKTPYLDTFHAVNIS